MFSRPAHSLEHTYSSQDSQSLKSILDAGVQSSYSSHTSYEDIILPSPDADGSQSISVMSNESDQDSQLNFSSASGRRYEDPLPFRIELLSGGTHGSDSQSSSVSNPFSDSEAAQLLQLVAGLRKRVSQLEKNEVRWKIQIQVLEGKLETSRSMYDSLLERLNSLSINTKSSVISGSHNSRPTFHDLLLDLCRQNKDIPSCPRPKGTIYWTREEWHQEYQNGRGNLSVLRRPNESATGQGRQSTSKGSTPFIIGKDGYIVDGAQQGQMRDHMQSLWQTLAIFELAPTSWSKATSLATEFVALSMRLEFEEFRLCDKDWKADAFATRHYPNWKGNPHSATIKNEVKQEESVSSTQKAVEMMVNGPLLKRPHASPAIAASPQTPSAIHRSKKKKDDHVPGEPSGEARVSYSFDEQDPQSALIDAPIIHGLESTAPASSLLSRAVSPLRFSGTIQSGEKPSPGGNRINIINPLSRWTKGRNSLTDQSADSAPASARSSTTELTQQLANTHVTNPDEIAVPSTSTGRMDLFQKMSKSFQVVATSSEPKAKGNPGGQQRHTAKGICRTEYMEQNPGKTNSQFELYWRKLPEEQKKVYADKFQASKTKTLQAKGKGKAGNGLPDVPDADDSEAAPHTA